MLRRDDDFGDYKTTKFFFTIVVDSYWAANLVYDAYAASDEGYEVSYGQV